MMRLMLHASLLVIALLAASADWSLDHPPYPDPFPEAGPISLTLDPFRLQYPVSRIIFHFVSHNGEYLIDAIELIPATQTAP